MDNLGSGTVPHLNPGDPLWEPHGGLNYTTVRSPFNHFISSETNLTLVSKTVEWLKTLIVIRIAGRTRVVEKMLRPERGIDLFEGYRCLAVVEAIREVVGARVCITQ